MEERTITDFQGSLTKLAGKIFYERDPQNADFYRTVRMHPRSLRTVWYPNTPTGYMGHPLRAYNPCHRSSWTVWCGSRTLTPCSSEMDRNKEDGSRFMLDFIQLNLEKSICNREWFLQKIFLTKRWMNSSENSISIEGLNLFYRRQPQMRHTSNIIKDILFTFDWCS